MILRILATICVSLGKCFQTKITTQNKKLSGKDIICDEIANMRERNDFLKTVTKIISLVMATILLCLPVMASNSEKRWYFKPNDSHTQPPLPSEFSFIEEYGGFYIDHEHNDDSADKVIYLTFDVGYENGNVAKILDILKAHNAKGTFFVLENVIKNETELVNRMFDEGHTVANHTMTHRNMSAADRSVFESELYGLEKLCLDLTGKKMAKIYRPPEGCFSENNMKILHEMGYSTVFWSCAYADWDNNKQPSHDKALHKLTSRLHNGEILLLHPTSATNAAIMDEFLTHLENNSYRFGSVAELCGK